AGFIRPAPRANKFAPTPGLRRDDGEDWIPACARMTAWPASPRRRPGPKLDGDWIPACAGMTPWAASRRRSLGPKFVSHLRQRLLCLFQSGEIRLGIDRLLEMCLR